MVGRNLKALDTRTDQPAIAELLRRALEHGRVAHAYAFVGPAGTGRMSAAMAFAQALVCEGEGPGPCGRCRGCRMAETASHPDLHVIAPTPPASNPKGARAIRIDAVRELERQASLRPVMAPRKVFIVDDADRMTDDAPQAFLKTLEEPPDRTVIILVLERARAVPATVISRCQLVRFLPRAAAPPPETGDALALLDRVSAGGMATILTRGDRIEREKAEGMVDAYWLWCRDLLLAKAEAPEELFLNRERASDIAREAQRWSAGGILAAIDLCRDAREALAHNVTPRLTIEVVVSRLALATG
jgi:DNA polymerase-3 subunit delta'